MTPVVSAAFALLSLCFAARRAGPILAGGVVVALGQASLLIAGGPNWRGAGLPHNYLSVTAAILAAGALWSLFGAYRSRAELRVPTPVALGMAVVLAGLAGWVLIPVALAGGLSGTLLTVAILGLSLAALGWVGQLIRGLLTRSSLARDIKPGSSVTLDRPAAALLGINLGLAGLALAAPHLVLLLASVVGSTLAGLMLERRVGGRRAWAVIGGLALLLLVSGLTIEVAGPTPLSLAELSEGPFSPAFEPGAALGLMIAAWPLLRVWPFHRTEAGPFTPVAGAALLVRVTGPVLAAGTEHWQPVVIPLLVFATLYSALRGELRVAIYAVAVGGLVSLYPQAVWAGVVLLTGEGLLASVSRFSFAPAGVTRAVGALRQLILMLSLVPILIGVLKAETFYSVLIVAGLALALQLNPDLEPAPSAR